MSAEYLDLERLEFLSRVKLSEKEREILSRDLPRILEFFKELDKAPLKDVEPLFHVMELSNVAREDECKPSLPQDAVLALTPSHERGFVKAPRLA